MDIKDIIKSTLAEYAAIPNHRNTVQDKIIADDEAGVYQWLSYGWQDLKRIFHVLLHLEVRDGYVWIERNSTDIEIGEVLSEKGIPKNQIVLGFQAPYKRSLNGFANPSHLE